MLKSKTLSMHAFEHFKFKCLLLHNMENSPQQHQQYMFYLNWNLKLIHVNSRDDSHGYIKMKYIQITDQYISHTMNRFCKFNSIFMQFSSLFVIFAYSSICNDALIQVYMSLYVVFCCRCMFLQATTIKKQ